MNNIEQYLLNRIKKLENERTTYTYESNRERYVSIGIKLTVYKEILNYIKVSNSRTIPMSENFRKLLENR